MQEKYREGIKEVVNNQLVAMESGLLIAVKEGTDTSFFLSQVANFKHRRC